MTDLLERIEAEHGVNGVPEPEEEEPLIPVLFASDMKAERFEVPGHPGSYIECLGMGGEALAQWMEGEGLKLVDGKLQTANMSVVRQQRELILNSLTDYCFIRRKWGKNDPESYTDEQTRPPGVERKTKHWREFTEMMLFGPKDDPNSGMSFKLREWVAERCLEVNGLLPGQRKN